MSTRLTPRKALEHPLRAELVRTISQRPGVTFLELYATFEERPELRHGLGFGSLAYHLHQLERFAFITSRRSGRHRRFYENGGLQGGLTSALAALQTPAAGRIARVVIENPGASQCGLWLRLRDTMRCTRQSVGYHLMRLESHTLIVSGRAGRAKAYFATERLLQLERFATAGAQTRTEVPMVLEASAAAQAL